MMPEELQKPFDKLWKSLPWAVRFMMSKVLAESIFVAGATAGLDRAMSLHRESVDPTGESAIKPN